MENAKINVIKSTKYIGIILVIIFTIFVIILIRNNDKNALKKKLEKNGYEMLVDNIYSKSIESNNKKINYTYKINNGEFSKTIYTQTTNDKENTTLTYKNDTVKINYNYQNTDGCILTQTGVYQKEDFTCNTTSQRGTCTTKCDVMLETIKEFKQEAKEIKPNFE